MTLDDLLDPSSVAVVGASPDSWYSSRLVENLLEYGYGGQLYLVNPSREVAWGRVCYDGVGDLPSVPDLVVVSVPRESVPEAVREAGECGVGAALVLSAGFGEADKKGAQLEKVVSETADETGIRVCGPNCIGVTNPHTETVLTSTCERKPEPGGVALVSQSGALAFTTFYERGTDEGVSFARIASTGNEADLTVGEFIKEGASDEKVNVVCCYIEGTDEPREFLRAANEATAAGTPVLVVKVGRSEEAKDAAVSHTGALTGDDDVWDAALRQAGVERVPDIPDLLWRGRAHDSYTSPSGSKLCVASTSGGLASLLADYAAGSGLELPPLSGETEDALQGIDGLLNYGGFGNPIDIRGYGADRLPEIADALLGDKRYDLYVFAIGLSAVDDRAEAIADDLSSIVEQSEAPVFVLWTGRKEKETDAKPGYERLRDGDYGGEKDGVPVYYDPKRCIDAVVSLVNFAEAEPSVPEPYSGDRAPAATETETLGWEEATRLLGEYGIDTVETCVVGTTSQSSEAAKKVGGNVVVKTASPEIPHRKEVGGVVTDLNPSDAPEAYEKVVSNVEPGTPEPNRALVQPQVEGHEVLVGISHTEAFGNVVTVGTGGSYAEATDDTAILVPPFDSEDTLRALGKTAVGNEILRDDTSTEAVVGLIERVGELASDRRIRELDLNPVFVNEDGCEIVDVLAVGDL